MSCGAPSGYNANTSRRDSQCCDIVNWLRNDISFLLSDAKRVAVVRLERLATQRQYDSACNDLNKSLNSLISCKPRSPSNHRLTDFKILETKHFLRYFWSLLNAALTKEAKKAVFISYKGLGVTEYVSQLKERINFIQNDSLPSFRDPECREIFINLSKQLDTHLVIELAKADAVQSSASSVDYGLTAVTFIKQLVGLYVQSSKWVDYHNICHHFLEDGRLPAEDVSCDSVAIKALSSLLDGSIFGREPIAELNPAVENRARDFFDLAEQLRLLVVPPILSGCTDSFVPEPHLFDSGLIDIKYKA
ncbi:Hypothetical protein NTJ_15923 [Nesidiocoris tenuis]|uniref:Uncharacterized protein n=1 Tax=Nesidiocoris tenuis TaxID=355587 RepID=A0ABN7BFF4_9HEMI|nr:Hypothetical protein NTJ_15923 [Nesidiocoris tenuis]